MRKTVVGPLGEIFAPSAGKINSGPVAAIELTTGPVEGQSRPDVLVL